MRKSTWLVGAISAAAMGGTILATAAPAYASATGTNRDVYATISGPASQWNLSAHAASSFYGHLEVVSDGIVWYDGPNEWNPSVSNVIDGSTSGTLVCVIGWQQNGDGSYTNVGEPCFDVYN